MNPVQFFRQLFDLRVRFPGCGFGVVQISRCLGSGIRAVLHGFVKLKLGTFSCIKVTLCQAIILHRRIVLVSITIDAARFS